MIRVKRPAGLSAILAAFLMVLGPTPSAKAHARHDQGRLIASADDEHKGRSKKNADDCGRLTPSWRICGRR